MCALFKKNLTLKTGGGFTSEIIPVQLTKSGVGVGIGIGAAATLGSEMFAQHNRLKMGPVTYTGGPDRI